MQNLSKCMRVFAAGLLLTYAAGTSQLAAQTTDGGATLSGPVQDIAGKGIAGASVSMKNESTGAARSVVTTTDGKFSATGLAGGMYTIDASAPSFAPSRRTGVKVAANGSE